MTEYSNPRLPEHINNSERRPFREFLWLTGGVLGAVVIGVLVLGLAAQWVAPKIPFAYESGLSQPLVATLAGDAQPGDARIAAYLQGLADRIAAAQGLPKDMPIQVHYVDDDTVNALATLGGHVLVYRGLLQRLPHENALTMVLSHEIAHVTHRDPIVSLGRGVVVAAAVAALVGVSSNSLADQVVGEAGTLTQLGFSRSQERAADKTGLAAVAALYGHTGGASDLYVVLREESGRSAGAAAFFQTHPDLNGRIASISELSRRNGWPLRGRITPLPDWLATALGSGHHPAP
jgi:predicted Zn-dependent protease